MKALISLKTLTEIQQLHKCLVTKNIRLEASLRRDDNELNARAQQNLIRGDRYNDEESTIPSPKEIASKLNVKPTKEAPAKTWLRAWKIQKRLLPILHSLDRCKPPDSSFNLACMWWKALSGNDKSSPVFDNGLAYDLLPSGFRWVLKFRRLFPRFHHANVELRTAYLDASMREIVSEIKEESGNKIRLVCMGAGYDLRGFKMLERKLVDKVYELDLPEVVKAKERLFRNRLLKRRPSLSGDRIPQLIPADLNDLEDVRCKLNEIVGTKDLGQVGWHTIFVFEAVMIYLNEGVPSALLKVTSDVLNKSDKKGHLLFADRLENVPGGDVMLGEQELRGGGWQVLNWSPKPGVARHMFQARLLI